MNGYWEEQEKEGILGIKDGMYLRDELEIIKCKCFKEMRGMLLFSTTATEHQHQHQHQQDEII